MREIGESCRSGTAQAPPAGLLASHAAAPPARRMIWREAPARAPVLSVALGRRAGLSAKIGHGHPALPDRGEQDNDAGSDVRWTKAVLRYPLSVLRYPLSAIRCPLSVVRKPLSLLRLPFAVCRSPSSVCRSPLAESRKPKAECRKPNAESRMPNAKRRSSACLCSCARGFAAAG